MPFKRTTAVNKILAMRARKKVIQGGTWAGKTFGITAVALVDYCTRHPRYKVTVVGETIPALKEGPLSQFEEIMQDTGRWVQSRFNKNGLTYTFANGTRLQFRSFDSVGKAKAAGKRNALFINEANYIPFEIADTLILRTENDIWIDFNPDAAFWVHEEILPQPDAEFLLLKYTDNEACPQTIIEDLKLKLSKAYHDPNGDHNDIANIKSSYWANWCKVYIDGEVGALQGAVFTNWSKCTSIPAGAKHIGTGLDFGFTNDPTAVVDVWQSDGELYVDELIYRTGLTNPDIYSQLKQGGWQARRLVADSAEPKSIEELRRMGAPIEAAKKGQDSIKASIDILQRYKLNVTERSTNLIGEFRTYCWLKDKDGNALNEPVDFNNHAIDALRYVALNKLSNPSSGKYSVMGSSN